MADPARSEIGVRFEEAIDFLRRRLALPEGVWLEMVREIDVAARDRSAGMSDALARDVLAAALEAVETGATSSDFLAGFSDAIGRHGWTSGDAFEDSRRAELTFRLMTSQAYAAGRWKQIQRLKAVRTYLRYVHVDPLLTQKGSRDEHAAWHNVILPVDHAWWLTHYPPNGFNCRCYVQSLSERDLVRYGWSVSTEAPPSRTDIRFVGGRPVETPAGIDPGFAFNAGIVGLRLEAA